MELSTLGIVQKLFGPRGVWELYCFKLMFFRVGKDCMVCGSYTASSLMFFRVDKDCVVFLALQKVSGV